MEKGINVLSLFDGISCGQLALKRAGINVNKYYASEVDKHTIKICQHNFPNTIQLGDVTKVIAPIQIDLLLGGSPCQGFSSSGKGLNFEDPRSKLFFEFVRILKEVQAYNPEVAFLLENVIMKKEHQDVITKYLGVEPILIDSKFFSAQTRKRLYWTNIKFDTPSDKGIQLVDILEDCKFMNPGAIRGRNIRPAGITGRRLNEKGVRKDNDKSFPIVQCLEVKDSNKSNCLTTVQKDNVLTFLEPGRYLNAFDRKEDYRHYTLIECCRLQTLPDNYFNKIITDTQALKAIGNGWTIDVISHILKNLKWST